MLSVDCVWDTWHVEECSVTCGEGVIVKHRTKLQEELFGGAECEGVANVTETCNAVDKCLSNSRVDALFVSILT